MDIQIIYKKNSCAYCITLLTLMVHVACAQTNDKQGVSYSQIIEIVPNDPQGGQWFGYSVAASANRIVVGAPNEDDPLDSSGAVYVFERKGEKWIQRAKLIAQDATGDDDFGHSVAIDGDLILVGAPRHHAVGERSGAAYLFRLDDGSWKQEAKLIPEDAKEKEEFGVCVALEASTAVVGLQIDNDNLESSPNDFWVKRKGQGSVYVFQHLGDQWHQTARITPNEWKKATDGYGSSVALNGNTLVVGAYSDKVSEENCGSLYIYQRDGQGWQEATKLTASDPLKGAHFGRYIAIDGDHLLVGAPGEYNHFYKQPHQAMVETGAAYLFRLKDGIWSEIAKVKPNDGKPGDSFGRAVAVTETQFIVGATASERPSYVRVFKQEQSKLEAAYNFNQGDPLAGNYGSSLAATDKYLVIGAFSKTSALGSGTGIVYVAF